MIKETLLKLVGLSIILAVVGVGIMIFALLRGDGPSGEEPPPLERDAAGRIVVGEERIPGGYQEALEAAPFEVMPHTLPEDTGQGGVISQAERKQLNRAVRRFLAAWETFDPYEAGYRNKLKPLSAPNSIGAIASREESTPKGEICHDGENCLLGSRWLGLDGRIEIRRAEEMRAWITAYGVVEIRSQVPEIPHPAEGIYPRSYGLMLRRDDVTGKWLVERAVAETLDNTIYGDWGNPEDQANDAPGH